MVDKCPDLSWQFVTKRVGNVAKMLPPQGRLPENSILLITAVNQEEVDRDVPKLLALKDAGRAPFVGVSYEPALGPVDWTAYVDGRRKLDWIIVGGESRQGPTRPARPFALEWAEDAVRVGRRAGVAVFVKQVGDNATHRGLPLKTADGKTLVRAGSDPDQWPQALRVRDFPPLPL